MRQFYFRFERRICISCALAAFLCLSSSSSALAERPTNLRPLEGTFIQLTEAHLQWKSEQWKQLFASFQTLRLKYLVVQWTEYDNVSFYPTPVDTILKLADESQMSVLLGLAQDTSFWTSIHRDPKLVSVYLRRLRMRSESIAKDLAPIAAKYKSFAGWYISEEIEDFSWREPPLTNALAEHLRQLVVRLHEVSRGSRVAISGFSNGQSDPGMFEEFWRTLLKASSIDVLMFQDGVGAGKLNLSVLPLYIEAARRATEAAHSQLNVIVELFQPIDPLQFKPAPLDRVLRQLEVASHEHPQRILAFSVPEYMSPLGGAEAERLFVEYLAVLP